MNLTVSLRGSQEVRGACRIVHLTGQLDSFSEPSFRKEMNQFVEQGPPHIILDMKAIDFLDSSGLGVLVQFAKKLSESGSLQVVSNPRVTQTVKLVRLEKFLALQKSLEDALANVPQAD
ncbi:STAS domain-containing protein [Synechococcus sp. PCC 7336]|uniref:STAS domain-containing protein n=1 Tax=Synechococcus sp. PCC 7336 TaxID=195250 RepID=UPI000344B34A|nr:STAS domain-containing protein [Synechococcus sp. PCC 7336]